MPFVFDAYTSPMSFIRRNTESAVLSSTVNPCRALPAVQSCLALHCTALHCTARVTGRDAALSDLRERDVAQIDRLERRPVLRHEQRSLAARRGLARHKHVRRGIVQPRRRVHEHLTCRKGRAHSLTATSAYRGHTPRESASAHERAAVPPRRPGAEPLHACGCVACRKPVVKSQGKT